MTLRDEITELVQGGPRRVERPSDAAETDVTPEDVTNLRNAVRELQQAVVRLAEEVDNLRGGSAAPAKSSGARRR
jgi:hypothetical protein